MTVQYKTLWCEVRLSSCILHCHCLLVYRTLSVNWALTVHWTPRVCWMLAMTFTLYNSTHRFTNREDVKPYKIYGVTVGEVEVDILTGQHQVSWFYIVMCWGVPYSYVLKWAVLLCVWGGLYYYVFSWTLLLCVDLNIIVMCWGGLYCYM